MRTEKYITRTVTVTTVTVIGIDLNTNTAKERDIVFNDRIPDNDKIVDRCKKANKDNNFAIAAKKSVKYSEAVYECTVEEFMSIAKISTRRDLAVEAERKAKAKEKAEADINK